MNIENVPYEAWQLIQAKEIIKWLRENVEYAVMKKNGKHTIELAGVELAEDLQKDMRI